MIKIIEILKKEMNEKLEILYNISFLNKKDSFAKEI